MKFQIILIFTMSVWLSAEEPHQLGRIYLDVARFGDLHLVQEVIKMNIDKNFQGAYGETALHQACSEGQLEIVKYLTGKGLSMTHRDRLGRTPCLLAAEKGHGEVVNFLLNKGADPNTKDKSGTSILMWACASKDLLAVKSLLGKGASVLETDVQGRTALDMVRFDFKNMEITKILMEFGGKQGKHERKDGDLETIKRHERDKQLQTLQLETSYALNGKAPLKSKKALYAYFGAMIANEQGNINQAVETLNEAESLEKAHCLPCDILKAELFAKRRIYEETDLLVESLMQAGLETLNLAELEYTLGIEAFNNSDFEFAARYFERSFIEQKPINQGIYYYLGCIYDDVGNLDRARELLKKYLIEVPDGALTEIVKKRLDSLKPTVFPVLSFEGKRMDLAHYGDKMMLLDFWSANGDYEKGSFRVLNKVMKGMSEQPFIILSVNVDDEPGAREMISDLKPDWPQFLDPRLKFFRTKYMVSDIPTFLILKPDGVVLERLTGTETTNPKSIIKTLKKHMK